MKENEIPYQNLFMVCTQLNPKAFSELPAGYHFRLCRKDEPEAWKRFPYDNPEDAEKYNRFMCDYYDEHYTAICFFKNVCLYAMNRILFNLRIPAYADYPLRRSQRKVKK